MQYQKYYFHVKSILKMKLFNDDGDDTNTMMKPQILLYGETTMMMIQSLKLLFAFKFI